MKSTLLILVVTALFCGKGAAAGPEQIITRQVSVPGVTATFYLRGTNLVYERVGYQANGPSGGPTNSWAERFYYHGELVFRRCRTESAVTETALGSKGVILFRAQGTPDLSGILVISEVGQPMIPTGKDWVPPFEVFSLGIDGFYHPKDRMQHVFSSRIWPSDIANPTVDKPVQKMRIQLLKGEPTGAASRSQPFGSETNRTPAAAGSGR